MSKFCAARGDACWNDEMAVLGEVGREPYGMK